jgi:hypothetical protein
MKTYWGRRRVAPHILNFSARWKEPHTPITYEAEWTPETVRTRCEEKNPLPVLARSRTPVVQPVTKTLYWLIHLVVSAVHERNILVYI